MTVPPPQLSTEETQESVLLVDTVHRRIVHVLGHGVIRILATTGSQQELRRIIGSSVGSSPSSAAFFIDHVHTVGDVIFPWT